MFPIMLATLTWLLNTAHPVRWPRIEHFVAYVYDVYIYILHMYFISIYIYYLYIGPWVGLFVRGFLFWTFGYPELFIKYFEHPRTIYKLPPELFINYWKDRPRINSYLEWSLILHLIILKTFVDFLSARSLKGMVAKKKWLEIHEGLGQACNQGPSKHTPKILLYSICWTSNFDREANHSYEFPPRHASSCKTQPYVHLLAFRNAFRARLPWKRESGRCENQALVRDCPQKVKVEDVKTKLWCETSLKKWK